MFLSVAGGIRLGNGFRPSPSVRFYRGTIRQRRYHCKDDGCGFQDLNTMVEAAWIWYSSNRVIRIATGLGR